MSGKPWDATEMRYIAAGIVFGWMVGFVGAVVAVGSVMLLAKGIWKIIQLIRSATRKGAARDDRQQNSAE